MASLLKTHDMIKDVCSVRLNAPSSVEGGNASHHDHHDIETLKQTIEMLQLKGQEYEEKLDHLKTTWEEQYSHVRVDDLLKLEQDVQRLAVQVEEKERRLRSFADLDPVK